MQKNIPVDIQQKIIDLITILIPDAKIYLFGSRARGTHSEWSDIDIALDAGSQLPIAIVGEVKSVLEATNMPYTVDIVDYYLASPTMQQHIKQEGIVWKA